MSPVDSLRIQLVTEFDLDTAAVVSHEATQEISQQWGIHPFFEKTDLAILVPEFDRGFANRAKKDLALGQLTPGHAIFVPAKIVGNYIDFELSSEYQSEYATSKLPE